MLPIVSIKAVAFDYGGVISFFQDKEDLQGMADLAGIDVSLMKQIYWDNRPVYDKGLVDGKDYFRNILAGVGVIAGPELLEKLCEKDIESWSHINPKTEQLMKELKESGFTVAVLSNIGQDLLDRVKDTLPVFTLPDVAVYSCEVNTVKPEEKMYRLLVSRLDCKAEELVFFDDKEANVEAACTLGIQALLWKGPEDARKNLEALGSGPFGR